jgi:xanthine/uracil/vitamin C permease (AzgA family)
MSDGFSIGAVLQGQMIVDCPHCNAQSAAELLAEISQACNAASHIASFVGISVAFSLLDFFSLLFIPFHNMLPGTALTGVLLFVPVLALRWKIRFGQIVSQYPDFRNARRTVTVSGIVGGLLLCFILFLSVLTLIRH